MISDVIKSPFWILIAILGIAAVVIVLLTLMPVGKDGIQYLGNTLSSLFGHR